MRVRWQWVVMTALVVSLGRTGAGTALAHKGKLPEDALTLVRQASALLAQNPGMTGEARERLELALRSTKTQGVNLDQVRAALAALDRADIAAARRLLVASIRAAGMPGPPAGVARTVPPPVPEPQGGRAPAVPGILTPPPPVDVAMKMAEPLRVGFTGSPAEGALLAVAFGLIGLGLTTLWRSRGEVRP